MLSRSHKINEILRDYQAVALLGNTAEFRQALIKLIFKYALEARFQIQNAVEPSKNAERIYSFLDRLDGEFLVDTFRTWWQSVPVEAHSSINSRCALEDHFEPIEAFLKWLPPAVQETFCKFDRHCEGVLGPGALNVEESPKLLQILLWDFLDKPCFRGYLEGKGMESPCLSFTGLFNVLLFTYDTKAKKIHMVRPGVGQVGQRGGEYSVFKRYLPHLKEQEFRGYGKLYELLENEWDVHESFERIRPDDKSEIGLRTGWTTLTYRTTWENNRERLLDFFLGNLNSAQLRPVPGKPLLGFFQLQSPVEGLIGTLFPVDEFPEKSRVCIDGEIKQVCALDKTEMPRVQMAELPTNWFEEIGAISGRLDFVKGFKFMGHPEWQRLLYEGLGSLNEMVVSLRKAVEPLMVDASLRQFAEVVMHEINNDLGHLSKLLPVGEVDSVYEALNSDLEFHPDDKFRERMQDLVELIRGMKRLLDIGQRKTGAFYKLVATEGQQKVKPPRPDDRSLADLVKTAWCDYLLRPDWQLDFKYSDESALAKQFRGQPGDFEFALSIALRNAATYKRSDSVVSFEAKADGAGVVTVSWANETTAKCVERLRKKNKADDESGELSGMDFSSDAIRKNFEAELFCKIESESLDHYRIKTHFTVKGGSKHGDPFYIHPDYRVKLR